jgi:hypothetical protein
VVDPSDTGKFDEVPGTYTRFAVGEAPEGWERLAVGPTVVVLHLGYD